MADLTTKYIARNIKRIRLEKGLTQAALADKAKMNINYFAKVERAEIKPSVEIYEKIVKGLGVKSSEIFPF